MEGYATLRNRVQRFLKENPDVREVTLKRPAPQVKQVYSSGGDECYGRMPESCPIVRRILEELLPDDFKLENNETMEEVRDRVFSRIHNEVTQKFRSALEEVCDQKHTMMARLRTQARQARDTIEQMELEKPLPAIENESPRARQRREQSAGLVTVEVDEEDESIF